MKFPFWDLCGKIAEEIVSDNSFPIEWADDRTDAAYSLQACFAKYLKRYKKEIAETPDELEDSTRP